MKKAVENSFECENCLTTIAFEKTKVCGRCRKTNYCCVECQTTDWKFHKSQCVAYAPPATEKKVVGKKCPVCLGELFNVGKLPCGHEFHFSCIGELQEFNLKCPVCRADLPPSAEKSCAAATDKYLDIRRKNKRPDGTYRRPNPEQKAEMADLFRGMKQAADQGHPTSQFNIGMFYWQGIIKQKDEKEALAWFEKAAMNGYTAANAFMGQFCHDRRDHVAAVQWWLKAAEGGCVLSQFNLGHAYFSGDGIEKDASLVMHWWAKSAEGGCQQALAMMAQLHCVGGYGAPRDMVAAMKFFKQINLDALDRDVKNKTIFCIGAGFDEIKEFESAFSYLMASAKNGNPQAQFRISLYYTFGYGVEKDAELGLKWLFKAANGDAEAKNNLAVHMSGLGKHAEAAALWEESAAGGFCMAYYNLSVVVKSGVGVAVDEGRALELCLRAAEGGHAPAEYNLGCHFFDLRDFKKSFFWFNKSASKGHLDAIFCLAASYSEGIGVARDDVKAEKLCRIAAGRGHPAAIENLKKFL